MTDNQEPQLVDAEVAVEADDTGASVIGAIGDETGTQAAGAIVTDYEYAVALAAFNDEDAAKAAYFALGEAESQGKLAIEGVLVVKSDDIFVCLRYPSSHHLRSFSNVTLRRDWEVAAGLGCLLSALAIATVIALLAFL